MLWLIEKPVKIDLTTYENIRKNATGPGDDYNYFKNYYKIKTIDLSKQQVLDDNPKAREQINFTGNLDLGGQTAIQFIIEEVKETVLGFSQWTLRVWQFYFALVEYYYKTTQCSILNVELSNSQLIN